MFEDDAVETTKEDLDSLAEIVAKIDKLTRDIAGTEALLDTQRSQLNALRTGALPEALERAKLPSVTTESGRTIMRKQVVAGTWPKSDDGLGVAKAMAWLKDENLLDLVKTQLVVEFDKGDHAEAEAVFAALRALPQANKFKAASMKETVHHQTLNAMLRERLEKGKEIPLELFSGYIAWIADIVEPGGKKLKTARKK